MTITVSVLADIDSDSDCPFTSSESFLDWNLSSSYEFQMWSNELSLTENDTEILLKGGWLIINHIAAGNKLLRDTFPSQSGLQDPAPIYYKLEWNSEQKNFVQVLFVNGNHWVCVSDMFAEEGVDVYDSLPTIPEVDRITSQVACIISCPSECFDLNLINIQPQEGAQDCGLYALAIAYNLCADRDPFETIYDQPRMRPHLLSCFEQGMITAFPVLKKRLVRFECFRLYKYQFLVCVDNLREILWLVVIPAVSGITRHVFRYLKRYFKIRIQPGLVHHCVSTCVHSFLYELTVYYNFR